MRRNRPSSLLAIMLPGLILSSCTMAAGERPTTGTLGTPAAARGDSAAAPASDAPPAIDTLVGPTVESSLGTTVAGEGSLRVIVDSILSAPPLHRTHWGVAVVDARTGEPILLRQPEKLFITASNMKLLAIAAALDRLGPDYRFRTEVRAAGGADGVAESLTVRGSGDPTFSVHFFDSPLAPLDSLADSLRLAGLERVDGPLVVDASAFDEALVHPAWERFDLDWYYAAPVAPLAVAEAAVPVVITPTAVGAPARVEVLAIDAVVEVDARVMTVPGANDWDDELVRSATEDSLVLRGTIGAAAGPDTSWIAQREPGVVAGRALRDAVVQAGVAVEGPVVVVVERPEWPEEEQQSAGSIRVSWRSEPLASMLHLPLLESNNWVTEQLLKALGAEVEGTGGWSEGTAAAETFLKEVVGVPEGAVYMRDGSGLSAQNLITPAALVELLAYARRQAWGPLYRAALAEPGEAEGTLEERLLEHDGQVFAKTGTIRHVNSLSGYATTTDGREIIFSILTNASGQASTTVRAAIDSIVSAIIEHGS